MARAEGSVALQQLAGVSGFWPGCPLVRGLGVPWPCAAAVRLFRCIHVSLCCLHACVLIRPWKME